MLEASIGCVDCRDRRGITYDDACVSSLDFEMDNVRLTASYLLAFMFMMYV